MKRGTTSTRFHCWCFSYVIISLLVGKTCVEVVGSLICCPTICYPCHTLLSFFKPAKTHAPFTKMPATPKISGSHPRRSFQLQQTLVEKQKIYDSDDACHALVVKYEGGGNKARNSPRRSSSSEANITISLPPTLCRHHHADLSREMDL